MIAALESTFTGLQLLLFVMTAGLVVLAWWAKRLANVAHAEMKVQHAAMIAARDDMNAAAERGKLVIQQMARARDALETALENAKGLR